MKYDIGIIGGAGPMAGRLFFDKIITWYQRNKGSWRDEEFPSILLCSYPFSDMLTTGLDRKTVTQELVDVIQSLDVKYLIIACNTLHVFGEGVLSHPGWIHLMKTCAEEISNNSQEPLVLCTTTSNKDKIHQRYFDCTYPPTQEQEDIDRIIEGVLKGELSEHRAKELESLIDKSAKDDQPVVLGCTELSLLVNEHPINCKNIIDLVDIAVEKVCQLLNTTSENPNPS